MDILDQIDRALREVDEYGQLTDAMRWVPDGEADQQEAELMGRYVYVEPGSSWAETALSEMYQRYIREAAPPNLGDGLAGRRLTSRWDDPRPPITEAGRRYPEEAPRMAPESAQFFWRPVGDDGPWRPLGDFMVTERRPGEFELVLTPQETAALQRYIEHVGHVVRDVVGRAVLLSERLREQLGEVVMPPDPPADPMARALEARRNRNTGPAQRQRAPRRIDPRGHRQ